LFSGFWSKDEILHSAHGWKVSHVPFYLGLIGAALTAFYMTRQMYYVFSGTYRGGTHDSTHGGHSHAAEPRESPAVMIVPLVVLAVFAALLGFLGMPWWPWFQRYLSGESGRHTTFTEALPVMLMSAGVVAAGWWLGRQLYGRKPISNAEAMDPLERRQPGLFAALRGKLFIDELYAATVIRFHAWTARMTDWLDRCLLDGMIAILSNAVLAVAWVNRMVDEYVINFGFDRVCRRVQESGEGLSKLQDGQVQHYLRVIGLALTILVLLLTWGCGAP
jgi:NADH-quinone oxidoreductase subunit L